ncbi:hypothetical protein AQJ58_17615 [Streptomyces sp. DSM 15324]|nr:hypothetical protein AQJ58_17615 [Streptomyces sp. DSM 15324]
MKVRPRRGRTFCHVRGDLTAHAAVTAPSAGQGTTSVAGADTRRNAPHIPARLTSGTSRPSTAPTPTTVSASAAVSRRICPPVTASTDRRI